MKNLYLKIIDVFKTDETKQRFIDKELTPVNHVDFYRGQDYNQAEAHNFPALFVKWSVDYTQSPPSAILTFRVAWEQLRDTSSTNPTPKKSLKFIDFINLVDEILKEIETEHTSKFTLLNEELNVEDTIVDSHTLSYRCSYTGKSKIAKIEYKKGSIESLNENGHLITRFPVGN